MQKNTANPLEKNTRTAFGVKILTSQHKDIRRIKREQDSPSIHGNKFWGSSYLMMDYLTENPPEKGSKVLELGCGWGLAGIHCARHFDAKVTAVDADNAVFPYLHLHAEHNAVDITTQQKYFEKITNKQLAQYDLIIAADVCFWDELADTVYQLIKRACEAGAGKIVIADPERPPFFTMAERCIDEFYGELEHRQVDEPRRATGALLVIENA
ncbi:MAG: methyltransferase domain-containing protein [Oceanicoccus sp.]|uniref:class I SAM-dependent methyltransferase n=1 Tax=Oceanicoccus sp. TaxID=2691044 RepID=UPI0026199FB5|nr:methyltransferase domain-containing protein [Oceanicoccus sp.]MCP3909039.1 methyltransferase domain-containing protein [Oceanicoccus sp.]MDG1772510.1 methyltransferase domain-containing protein [Oceanicoccus sp.]